MRVGILSLILGGLLTTTASASASEQDTGLLVRSVEAGQASFTYQVYIPRSLQGKRNLPVIVFLHGIGQRGTGGFLPTEGMAGTAVRHYMEQVPAIVLLPQCRRGSYWTDPVMDQMVMRAIEKTVSEFDADASRLYLTGVSMGGFGAWHLASAHPNRFAALVSICGGSPLRDGDRFTTVARRIGQTPAWVFHGAADKIVPVTESRRMVDALKAVNGNVRYSEYEGVGHNVWLKALAEKELLPWILTQRLNST
jgi:predicted peptidase